MQQFTQQTKVIQEREDRPEAHTCSFCTQPAAHSMTARGKDFQFCDEHVKQFEMREIRETEELQ